MAKLIMIVGTPGAGKSSVIAALSKEYNVFGVGTEMLNVGRKLGVVDNRDKIRYLDVETTAKIRKIVFANLKKVKKDTIIDTHASVRNSNNRYIPGVSAEEIKGFGGLKAIIYLDATAEEILMRRERDETRTREADTIAHINDQRVISIGLMTVYSVLFNAPIYMVRNHDTKLSKTIGDVKKIMKEILG